jgi:pyrroline-5-carboxylate reductase
MLDPARPLLLVGGGKMGEALLAGWLAQGVPAAAVRVVEPAADRREWLTGRYRVPTVAAPDELGAEVTPAVLLLAIKPQVMDAALPAFAAHCATDTLVLSIAAGKPIALFERALGVDRAVVRAMPNTPAAVGRGVTVLCANASASAPPASWPSA